MILKFVGGRRGQVGVPPSVRPAPEASTPAAGTSRTPFGRRKRSAQAPILDTPTTGALGLRPPAGRREEPPHCSGGTIISVGRKTVRWQPYNSDREMRTPLEAMRIDPVDRANTYWRMLGPGPRWLKWSLAEHLEYAAASRTDRGRERVVIIPCSNRKTQPPAGQLRLPARELYAAGSYHRAAARAAAALTQNGRAGRVLILSALHGLVDPEQLLVPYDVRVGDPNTVTAATLREQAHDFRLEEADVTMLGGRAYVQLIRQALPDVATPLAGTCGIGEQLARLSQIAKSNSPEAVARVFAAPARPVTSPKLTAAEDDERAPADPQTTNRAEDEMGQLLRRLDRPAHARRRARRWPAVGIYALHVEPRKAGAG